MTKSAGIESFRSGILCWTSDNLRSFPWRETSDPYEILIAEVLLQKTAASKVESVYREVISTYPSLGKLAEANQEELANIIYSLGLQNQRSKALISIGETLQNGGVPDEYDQLVKLPYVGRYAANATLCFAFHESRPIVDANVVRVYNRAFGKDFDYRDEEAWSFADTILPKRDAQRFNLGILDFAAAICRPRSPNCSDCFFNHTCKFI